MPIDNHPKDLKEFRELISSEKLVLVDFYATWCGPCKLIAPKLEKLAEAYPDVIFAKVDVDEAADIAGEVGVRAMPTFMYYKAGEKVGEVVGANIANIEKELKKHL
ncbi:thioredoxine 2 [Syncephalastrum racemosum]|uniref:Thioredoxin n=1 Tax=Syncephalastrum racemosum TaxID=13706 RepID=A0A1X2HGA5_SYNRA|nr:thioredoxine 2 [Syncephalastrum racemosum]